MTMSMARSLPVSTWNPGAPRPAGEALPLERAAQRRVLRPDALRDLEQAAVGVEREDAAVGHEHRAELEADEAVDLGPQGGEGRHPPPSRPAR